jgi:phosphatidate cytidylyltransferase
VIAALLIARTYGEADFTMRMSLTLLAAIYPAFFISFAILIRRDFGDLGWVILLFTFVNMWLADTFAYAFGLRFGRRKMTPRISPNKTWVGFVFAFPGGALAAVGAYYYLGGALDLRMLLVASAAATFFGQLGDMVESAIKRDCGAKDSSNLIPGHGGVLDRFDSLLFALPVVYFTFRIFG